MWPFMSWIDEILFEHSFHRMEWPLECLIKSIHIPSFLPLTGKWIFYQLMLPDRQNFWPLMKMTIFPIRSALFCDFCKLCCGVSLKYKVQTGATQFYQVLLGLYTFSNFLVNVKKKTKERILNRIESMFQPKMCYCFICFLMIIFCSSINLHPTVLQLH